MSVDNIHGVFHSDGERVADERRNGATIDGDTGYLGALDPDGGFESVPGAGRGDTNTPQEQRTTSSVAIDVSDISAKTSVEQSGQ